MPALSDYTNVFNTALNVLKQKGYRVWRDPDRRHYYAEKNGWDFMADGPVALLGVVAIFEHKKPRAHREYWWKDDVELDKTLPTKPPRFRSVVFASAKKAQERARRELAARAKAEADSSSRRSATRSSRTSKRP